MEPVELQDVRVALRAPRDEDVEEVYAACQDPEVQRWTSVPVPYRREDAEFFVAGIAAREWAAGTSATFLVRERASGALVGAMGLHDISAGTAEIGFWTAPGLRGRGLTTAAAGLLCRWGFEALGLARIEWQAYVGNTGSRRVAEKVGFRVEGTCRQRLSARGSRYDGWIGGLLPGDLR